MKKSQIYFALIVLFLLGTVSLAAADDFPKFIVLPDYVATPDGMVVCPKTGDLIVACPNFGDPSKQGCLLRINQKGEVSKWVDLPVHPETKVVFPMGIDLGPDGSVFICDNQNWPMGNGDDGELNQGRLLRVKIEDGKIAESVVVAEGLSHPNGVKIRDGFAYVTVSCLPKIKTSDNLLRSAVYRFPIDAQNIQITDTLADDEYIYQLFRSENKDCQYGADGIAFDPDGNLYVGIFGDGRLLQITPNKAVSIYASSDPIPPLHLADGSVDPQFLDKATQVAMRTTDGIYFDAKTGKIYVADFSNNAIAVVGPNGESIKFFAKSPDSDGLRGELNQPGEPCVWNGRLAVTCFDMVTDPDKVNRAHDPQAIIVFLPLDESESK